VRGLIVVQRGEFSPGTHHGSFYIVARDLAKILDMPVMGVDKTIYPFIAMLRPDLVISIGTLNTRILSTKLAVLTAAANRVIAYGVTEGITKKLELVSSLTNLAIKLNKLCIVVPSNYVKTELQSLGVKVEAVIPHGVDLKEMESVGTSKTILAIPDGKIKVFSVFSNLFQMRKRLGLHYLLLAWSRLSRDARKNACMVLKVPQGTGQLVNHLASSLGIKKGEYAILDTWLSRGQMFCLFKSADIYVHGTLADAFGLPLVESIACGTPVIALNAPPWNEIVNEKLGWLVKVTRETVVQRPSLYISMHRLRIPEVSDLSHKIATAVQFCEETDYEKMRERCSNYSHMFDVHNTYKRFKKLIEVWS